jgi:3',5'-nucleoside bisphosphate phosphatase
LGGIAIPAHVDRPANGLIALLGFVPPRLSVAALEISPNVSCDAARAQFHLPEDVALIRSSDAHWLDALGSAYVELDLEGPRCLTGLTRAFQDRKLDAFCGRLADR